MGEGGALILNIVQQYSGETIVALLNKMSERNEQVFDIVQLLLQDADDKNNNEKVILQGIQDIKETTEEINSKMDVVLEKLTKLESDFLELKNENRSLEEKIKLMTMKLSKMESNIHGEEIEDYYALAQSLYVNWEDLDQLTRRFIPLAEYLYSKLQKYDKPDYSPVILELCRAIENEFLLKIFKKYTMDLVARKGNSLHQFLSTDRATADLQDKTSQFVKAVFKASKTRRPEYTLGQMNAILSIVKNDTIVQRSPLLKDFEAYLLHNTEFKMLLDANYIKQVNEIVNKFRNPSAHPEFMSAEKATECREIMPERLDYLMECVIA